MTENERLFDFWIEEGWKFRLKQAPYIRERLKEYKIRLHHERSVVLQMTGYVDYFLMVSDIVRWAKDSGVAVGPGRGSGASSLICWLLRITEIDPMLYPMLFERFISVDRTDLPDLDLDFEDERRGEVIRYAQEKYGYDRVANILNFVRYKGRNSLDDTARVYRIPEWKIEAIKGKLVERADGHPRFAHTLEDTFDEYEDIAALVNKTPELMQATRLEGNYRNSSIHPAGIVIGSVPLHHICALYEKQSGKDRGSGVAYDKRDSEYLGLLKVDFLSLTTLTGIRATLDAIGMSIEDFYRIPLDDPKVYQLFRDGDMLGIFQFEGHATKRVLKEVQPYKFMDLVDVNALSRPGGDDAAYIRAKHTGVLPDPIHPNVDSHISWTYGTIVYQEQILLILRDLGKFPPADVNAIRKIISAKQDSTVFNEYLQRFIDGAAQDGVTEEQARYVWQRMVNATGYAFNISHAVCYTDTAYRQGWLKVYHPEFYLGQLQKCPEDKDGLDRRRQLIVEAERKGVKVNPPNLERSQINWTLQGGQLYAGWSAIKGIGPKVAADIVDWRDSALAAEELSSEPMELGWNNILEVPGIGPGRLKTIRDFAESDDPFGVLAVKRVMDSIRSCFDSGEFPGVPEPTHNSTQIVQPDEYVVIMGIIKKVFYKDTVSQRLKYGGEGLTREDVLEDLDEPHLIKYCSIDIEDEYDEIVRVRVGRKIYPQFKSLIDNATLGEDVVIATGYTTDFGGMAVQAKEIIVINPD